MYDHASEDVDVAQLLRSNCAGKTALHVCLALLFSCLCYCGSGGGGGGGNSRKCSRVMAA